MSVSKMPIQDVTPILIDRHLSRQLTVKLSLSDVDVTLAPNEEPKINSPVVHLGWGGSNWQLKRGYHDVESLVSSVAGDEKGVCAYWSLCKSYAADPAVQNELGGTVILLRGCNRTTTKFARRNIDPLMRFLSPGKTGTSEPSPICLSFEIELFARYKSSKTFASAERCSFPSIQFQNRTKAASHTWAVTRVKISAAVHPSTYKPVTIVEFAEGDELLFHDIFKLMTRSDPTAIGGQDHILGSGYFLVELVDILTVSAGILLTEAEAHLQILSMRAMKEDVTKEEHLHFFRKLHQLQPLWAQVRRQIVDTRRLAQQLASHPLVNCLDLKQEMNDCMPERVHFLDEELSRVERLLEDTKNLIGLAELEEGKASRDVATSARRVAILAFIYTPLQLVSGILSMDMYQVDSPGLPDRFSLWMYISMGLTFITLLGYLCYAQRARIFACVRRVISRRKGGGKIEGDGIV